MTPKSQAELSKARRERERTELVARIKDIARDMFVRDGYEEVTLHKIATALEYTRPAIYRYFKDKNDLLISIVLEDMEDLHAKLLACVTIADPLEKVIEMAHRNGEWAIAHPNHYLLFYHPAWTAQEDEIRANQGIPQDREPLYLLYKAIEEMMAQKKIKPEYVDAALLAKTVWACIHGMIMLEITMSGYDRALIHERDLPFSERLDVLISGLARGFFRE
jgi:AcrR family transcriptional regulator